MSTSRQGTRTSIAHRASLANIVRAPCVSTALRVTMGKVEWMSAAKYVLLGARLLLNASWAALIRHFQRASLPAASASAALKAGGGGRSSSIQVRITWHLLQAGFSLKLIWLAQGASGSCTQSSVIHFSLASTSPWTAGTFPSALPASTTQDRNSMLHRTTLSFHPSQVRTGWRRGMA